MNEETEISSHCLFLEDLASRYAFNGQNDYFIRHDLVAMHYKRNDPSLYLGIIGEFSSGKSTFINALMRDDFLSTDALQGTTAAATFFRYKPDDDLLIKYIRGENAFFNAGPHVKNRYASSLTGCHTTAEMVRAIARYVTTNEEVARTVQEVTVFKPAAPLKDGLVIIDTPGIQSLNARHKSVTEKVIAETCDQVVVILQSSVPLSSALADFLSARSSKIALHRCIFVISKIDQVRPVDRDAFIKNIKERVSLALGIPSPIIIAVSALFALEQLVDGFPESGLFAQVPGPDREALLHGFTDAEAFILTRLAACKRVVRLERVATLGIRVCHTIQSELSAFQKKCTAALAGLLLDKRETLRVYLTSQKEFYGALIEMESTAINDKLQQAVWDCWDGCWATSQAAIEQMPPGERLNQKMGAIYVGLVELQDALRTSLISTIKGLLDFLGGLSKQFDQDFDSMFPSFYPGRGQADPAGIFANVDQRMANARLPVSPSYSSREQYADRLCEDLQQMMDHWFALVKDVMQGIGGQLKGFFTGYIESQGAEAFVKSEYVMLKYRAEYARLESVGAKIERDIKQLFQRQKALERMLRFLSNM